MDTYISLMKKLRVVISKDLSNNSKSHSKNINYGDSKEVDELFLPFMTFFNIVSDIEGKGKRFFPLDTDNIIYLPLLYVQSLRKMIIKMYEKSTDPICTGYVSKSNIVFALDHIQQRYNDISDKREKLICKAAFLLYSIALKHPFVDGNKRTSIIACNSFLEYNGYTIGTLPFRKSRKFITDVAMGIKTETECQQFIRQHISKLIISEDTRKNIKELIKEIESIKNEQRHP